MFNVIILFSSTSFNNLLQQSSLNQQRDRSRYKSNIKTQEVSMEQIDQAKDQGKYTKKTVG